MGKWRTNKTYRTYKTWFYIDTYSHLQTRARALQATEPTEPGSAGMLSADMVHKEGPAAWRSCFGVGSQAHPAVVPSTSP